MKLCGWTITIERICKLIFYKYSELRGSPFRLDYNAAAILLQTIVPAERDCKIADLPSIFKRSRNMAVWKSTNVFMRSFQSSSSQVISFASDEKQILYNFSVATRGRGVKKNEGYRESKRGGQKDKKKGGWKRKERVKSKKRKAGWREAINSILTCPVAGVIRRRGWGVLRGEASRQMELDCALSVEGWSDSFEG